MVIRNAGRQQSSESPVKCFRGPWDRNFSYLVAFTNFFGFSPRILLTPLFISRLCSQRMLRSNKWLSSYVAGRESQQIFSHGK